MNLFYSSSYQQFANNEIMWRYLQQCIDRQEENILFIPSFNPTEQKLFITQLKQQQMDLTNSQFLDMITMIQEKSGATFIDEIISLEDIQEIEEQIKDESQAFIKERSLTFDQRIIEKNLINDELVLEKRFSKMDTFVSKKVRFSNREVMLAYHSDSIYMATIRSDQQKITYYLNQAQQIIMTNDIGNGKIMDFSKMKSYQNLNQVLQDTIEEILSRYTIKNYFFEKEKKGPQISCNDVTYIEC